MTNIYYIPHSNTCELAHELTRRQCILNDIELDQVDENEETIYTDHAQKIFDKYVTLIEETMLTTEIKTQKIDIGFTESDCQELEQGEEFDWSYDTEDGINIQVHLHREEDEEYDEIAHE